jgi:stage V sporulation protein SpoVS
VAQPRIGFLAVGFGSINKAVKLSAGRRTFVSLNNQFFLPITKDWIAHSAALLSIGK